MNAATIFASVLNEALSVIRAKGVPVFTFALYHDHESNAVSVCIDTEENSNQHVVATNKYNMGYFMKAVASGDLKSASLWQANIGRSLSLGDFTLVNVARTKIDKSQIDSQFYLTLVRALVTVQEQVAALSPNPESVVFACSGANDEVAYVWSLPSNA